MEKQLPRDSRGTRAKKVPKRRAPSEIIDEIVRRKLIDPVLRNDAQVTIDNLKRLADRRLPLWGNRKENLEYTVTLRKRIEKLQKTLVATPGHMLMLLFEPGADLPLDLITERAEENAFAFSATLGQVHARCQQLEVGRPGDHGNSDSLQRQVAVAAKVLMERCNKRVGSSSPESPFRLFAGLLYEAVTGEAGKDMERACDDIAAVPIRTE